MNYSGARNSMTDGELVEGLRAGSEFAVAQLVRRYGSLLKSFAFDRLRNKEDVGEVVNETMMRAVDSIDRFDSISASAFKSWIYEICKNIIRDRFRKKSREAQEAVLISIDETYESEAGDEISPAQLLVDQQIVKEYFRHPVQNECEAAAATKEFLQGLSEKDQTILNLCPVGVPHAEVAPVHLADEEQCGGPIQLTQEETS